MVSWGWIIGAFFFGGILGILMACLLFSRKE